MIRTTTVIAAIYHLGRRGQWPTSPEIATYLVCDIAEVRPALRELHEGRLFRPRQRAGRKVWMPWEAT